MNDKEQLKRIENIRDKMTFEMVLGLIITVLFIGGTFFGFIWLVAIFIKKIVS